MLLREGRGGFGAAGNKDAPESGGTVDQGGGYVGKLSFVDMGGSEMCVSDTPVVLPPELVIEPRAEELDWPGHGDE
jgi:hypothetical protein